MTGLLAVVASLAALAFVVLAAVPRSSAPSLRQARRDADRLARRRRRRASWRRRGDGGHRWSR